MSIEHPKAQMTPNSYIVGGKSNLQAKETTVTSSTINHSPRVTR